MKNAFYFTSKALSFLKIFKFFLWLFGHVAKRLDKKDKVNFIFYNVTAWLSNNCNTHIANISLPNISRSKDNQTIKFGQLIERNMRKAFLQKSNIKCGWTSPRPFSEKLNQTYLWVNSLKFYTVCFYCMPSWGLSKYIETKLQTTCFHLILSFFKK